MTDQGKVLVTGAAGTHGGTGGYLVAALKERGIPVRAMVRTEDERANQLRSVGAEVVVGDFLKLASLRKAMEGVDRVFFCYPLATGLLQATTNICAAAREVKVRAVANVSIMMAAPDHPSPVCRDHFLSESIFDWAGVKPIHLRAGFFFENLLRFARSGIQQENKIVLPFGDGTAKLAWVGTKDLANIAAAILADPESHAGKTYEITGASTLSIREIADILGSTLGRPISYEALALPSWLDRVAPVLQGNDQLRAHVSVLGQAFGSGLVIGRVNDLVEKFTGKTQQSAEAFARSHAMYFAPVSAA